MSRRTLVVGFLCCLLLGWIPCTLAQTIEAEPSATGPESAVQAEVPAPGPATPVPSEAPATRPEIRVLVDVTTYDTGDPGESRLQVVVANRTSHPVKVPAAYDGEYLVLYGQGDEHRHPCNLALNSTSPVLTRLPPDSERVLLDVPLAVLFTPRHGRLATGQMFWTWMAHPMPPATPIHRLGEPGHVGTVELWAVLTMGTVTVESEHIVLTVH